MNSIKKNKPIVWSIVYAVASWIVLPLTMVTVGLFDRYVYNLYFIAVFIELLAFAMTIIFPLIGTIYSLLAIEKSYSLSQKATLIICIVVCLTLIVACSFGWIHFVYEFLASRLPALSWMVIY